MSDSDKTIFKRIIDGEIPADVVHEDDLCLAFKDVAPQAPVHVLLIPKKELRSLAELREDDQSLMGHLLITASDIARRLQLDGGYRLICNCGEDGGQTVDHLHFHILGGRGMKWPPG